MTPPNFRLLAVLALAVASFLITACAQQPSTPAYPCNQANQDGCPNPGGGFGIKH
jgi:uncharacterized lipoprotein YajG